MRILGIAAYYHDAAACLVVDGEIVAAAQEERFTRKKHDPDFPENAIGYCLAESKLRPSDIDYVVFYDKPFLKFERLLETYLAFAPKGFRSFVTALPVWLKDKLFQKTVIANELKALWGKDTDWEARLLFSEHHLKSRGERVLPESVRTRSRADDGWCGRVDYDIACRRQRQPANRPQGNSLPAFIGVALLRSHLLHGLQGQQRRVQSDGARAIRRTEIRQADERSPYRHQG